MAWLAKDWEFAKDNTFDGQPMWMDAIHVETIYRLCMALNPEEMVEIGSYWGYSTSAMVQAKRDRRCGMLTCVDREIRPQLLDVVRRAKDRWAVVCASSHEYLASCWPSDFLILDGAHDLKTVQGEWERIGSAPPKMLIAHDVSCPAPNDGPAWLLNEINRCGHYYVAVDDLPREGKFTDRGLMVATTDLDWFHVVERIFAELLSIH